MSCDHMDIVTRTFLQPTGRTKVGCVPTITVTSAGQLFLLRTWLSGFFGNLALEAALYAQHLQETNVILPLFHGSGPPALPGA